MNEEQEKIVKFSGILGIILIALGAVFKLRMMLILAPLFALVGITWCGYIQWKNYKLKIKEENENNVKSDD